jgi:hypothetical protein
MNKLDALVATTIRYLRPALEDYSPCYHEPTDDILRAALIEYGNQRLEDAAKVCDALNMNGIPSTDPTPPKRVWMANGSDCTAACRALKE